MPPRSTDASRRIRLVPLVGVLALVLSSCIWPAFRQGPERTGFNSSETTLGAANVAGLVVKWTAQAPTLPSSSVAIANGVLYATGFEGLRAFSAAGTTGCSGTPKVCTPLWSASTGLASPPSVSDGVVFVGMNIVTFEDPFDPGDRLDGMLLTYDATGTTGCSGTPKVCAPLWTSPITEAGGSLGSPVVANGILYAGADSLQAYDPAGTTGCSGTPKVCTPLWSGSGGAAASSPAIAGGIAYQVAGGSLQAYDATGATGCSGTPVSCTPKWQSVIPMPATTPAVTTDLVYIGGSDGKLRAYKTAATFPQCSGIPKACNPLWTRTTGGPVQSSPAVANGVVYVGSDDAKLYALDAATGAVLWTASTGGPVQSSPAVANGVVYVGSDDTKVYAFDATGTSGCSGTPKVCSPLWSFTTDAAVRTSPVVANGKVFVTSAVGTLYSFGL